MGSNSSRHISCILAGLLIVLFPIGPLAAQDTPDPAAKHITGLSHTIAGLASGVEFKAAVRAVSSIGASNWSQYVTGTPD